MTHRARVTMMRDASSPFDDEATSAARQCAFNARCIFEPLQLDDNVKVSLVIVYEDAPRVISRYHARQSTACIQQAVCLTVGPSAAPPCVEDVEHTAYDVISRIDVRSCAIGTVFAEAPNEGQSSPCDARLGIPMPMEQFGPVLPHE